MDKKVTVTGPSLGHGVGRRKSSVARVWLKKGNGTVVVNGRELNNYFLTDITRMDALIPLTLLPATSSYDVLVNVKGGGFASQAGAVRLGISRAIFAIDESVRDEFKKHRLLSVDSRVKERKKYGQKAARRKFQFVKR